MGKFINFGSGGKFKTSDGYTYKFEIQNNQDLFLNCYNPDGSWKCGTAFHPSSLGMLKSASSSNVAYKTFLVSSGVTPTGAQNVDFIDNSLTIKRIIRGIYTSTIDNGEETFSLPYGNGSINYSQVIIMFKDINASFYVKNVTDSSFTIVRDDGLGEADFVYTFLYH